jgi:hypothetical protein
MKRHEKTLMKKWFESVNLTGNSERPQVPPAQQQGSSNRLMRGNRTVCEKGVGRSLLGESKSKKHARRPTP